MGSQRKGSLVSEGGQEWRLPHCAWVMVAEEGEAALLGMEPGGLNRALLSRRSGTSQNQG